MSERKKGIFALKRPENIMIEELGVEVIPFLTWDVIEYIGNVLLKMDGSYREKEIAKHALILKFCTDLTDEEISSLDYETIWVNGWIDKIESFIFNIDKIDEYVLHTINPNKQICDLLREVESFLKKMKKINWKDFVKTDVFNKGVKK